MSSSWRRAVAKGVRVPPKIDAPSVAQHRAQVQERLVDAAEALLRSGEDGALTAGAVSAAAGIARNSIYRYVDSVDELRDLVVDRYLPAWQDAVDAALAGVDDPVERLVTWVRVNLEQSSAAGHGWLMEAARTRHTPAGDVAPTTRTTPTTPTQGLASVDRAHTTMREVVGGAWEQLLGRRSKRAAVAATMTMSLVENGFRQLDAGHSPSVVIDVSTRAVAGMAESLTDDRS
ncbi:TetR/AcrR family transcriptional regulator [Knoellia sp. DB2414S]|uniref:TetR/AcrR family transcriptional regulator n=1 Tax=Knoellia koreensis TaxID=2730921 RepID=A0A849HM41_9MICO|nr:TetR/AcrR family transcriptional regulator [Knoellia sp. DB2414S]